MSLAAFSVYLEFASYFSNRSGSEVVYLEQAYPRPKYLFPTAFAFQTVFLSFSSGNAIVLANYLYATSGHESTPWGLKGVALAGYTVAFLRQSLPSIPSSLLGIGGVSNSRLTVPRHSRQCQYQGLLLGVQCHRRRQVTHLGLHIDHRLCCSGWTHAGGQSWCKLQQCFREARGGHDALWGNKCTV